MNQNKKYIFIIAIGILESLLLCVIVILTIKIKNLTKGKVKGAQYVTVIKKEDIIFSKNSEGLKYFYEPKPNNIETANPSWLGYEVKYTINSDSLNERFDYPVTKPDHTYRIITLGDSFTFGAFVNTAENYSELLENLLNNNSSCGDIKHFEVINIGESGYDIEYTVERFKRRGLKYNPDLVIWIINDWNFDKINELYLPEKKELNDKGVLNFDPKKELYIAPIIAQEKVFKKYGIEYIIQYQKNIIHRLLANYKNNLIFISFPNTKNIYKNIISETLLLRNNISYLTTITDIKNNTRYRLLDHHPNREGHRLLAEEIFEYIRTSLLQGCLSQLSNYNSSPSD